MTVADRPNPDNRPTPPDVLQRVKVLQESGLHKYANAILQEWRNVSNPS